jgi:UDP-3-O-[3-hydroxymyristoyl] glucosamine N-acyltransferase
MKLLEPVSAQWIADFIGAKLIGNEHALITGINEIHEVESGDLSFVDFEKYYKKMLDSAATFILINKEVACPEGKSLFICEDPFSAYIKLVNHFRPFEAASKMLNETAEIGEGTQIQPNVFIGNHVKIGKHCLIHPGVVIYDYTEIGDQVIIHAGVIIGADAFYFKRRKEQEIQYDKMESCGHVVIENNVEIGANTTIDKGVSGITRIGAGTKIDNQVHIGHDVVVGKNCLFAAKVAIAGVTTIEDEVTLWGQVGVNKDLVLGKGCVVLAQSGVGDNLEPGKIYFGSPAVESRKKMKELAWVKRIPEIWEKQNG